MIIYYIWTSSGYNHLKKEIDLRPKNILHHPANVSEFYSISFTKGIRLICSWMDVSGWNYPAQFSEYDHSFLFHASFS